MRSNVVKFKTLDGATTYDSVTDWGFTLTHCDEQKPAPKWERIDVPGGNGSVDVSAALSGDIPFEDRIVDLTFSKLCADHDAAFELANDVAAAVHGKQMQLQTPDAYTDGNTWYTGDVEITECRFEDRGCEIDVRAVCSPFRLSETGGELVIEAGDDTSLAAAKILAVPAAARTLARRVTAEYYTGASIKSSADAIAMCFADNSNLFDLDNATLRGVTIRTGTGNSWVKSNNIAQDGQKVAFGGVNVSWVERAAVIATSASVIPISGGDRVFPFAEDTRARVWLFSGTVTAVQSSVTADGSTYSAGAYLHYANGAWGTLDNGAMFSDGGTAGAYGTIAAPAVGGAWDGEYLDFAIDPTTTAIYIDLAGITATDVYALVAFYKAGETAPASWIEPNVQVKVLQLPYPFERYTPIDAVTSDTFVNGIAEASFISIRHNTTYKLQKIEDVPDAQYIQTVTANTSGELIRNVQGYLRTWLTAYEMIDYTVNAGEQPAYPTAETSLSGAVVEYNGVRYLLPSSATTQLDTLLNRGENTVSISSPTNQVAGRTVLTWPMGVL